MKYFLVKSDPEDYSLYDLEKDGIATWDGVRNAQAVIFLKQMQKGDRVLVYHSQGEASIVGLAEMIGNSRPDPNDARSWLIDLKFIRRFTEPFVTLKQIKQNGNFKDFRLVRQSRLSTMDVPQNFIDWFAKQPGVDLT